MNEYEQPGGVLPAGELPAPVSPEKPRFTASWREILAAVLMYGLAWIWFDITDTVWLLVFVLGFVALTELLHWHTPRARESWVWLGCVAIVTAALVSGRCRVFDDESLLDRDFYPLAILHIFAVWWALCRSGRMAEGRSGRLLPMDAVVAFCVIPFRHFFLRIRSVLYALRLPFRGKGRLRTETLLWSLGAVVIAVPLLIRAVYLLTQADAGFESLLSDFADWFRIDFNFLRLFLSLHVGAYCFGLLAGSARMDETRLQRVGGGILNWLGRLRKVPETVFTVLIAVFSVFYLVFFILQGSYLFGAFTRTLPEGFVVAEYARQGFFELCRVMAVNFVLLWLAARFAGRSLRESPALRIAALVLLAESLLFAVIAASKLGLYIDCFGFTPLRLLSSWLVCVLACGCVCAAVTILSGKKSFRAWMIFGAVTLSLLCLY